MPSSTRRDPLPEQDGLEFVRVRLSGEHVRASAAIPMLFPPVEVTSPRAARDHYIDGGTRLNTPIKPALALGADRVIVVGFEPFSGAARPPAQRPVRPHLSDVAANVVDGLLVDQVGDDLHRMVAINSFFAEHAGGGPLAVRAGIPALARPPAVPARVVRTGRSRDARRDRADRGARVRATLRRPAGTRLAGLSAAVEAARGRTRSRGELLSFLLFDHVFVAELIEAGRHDARRWIDRHPGFWCSDAAHDFDVGGDDGDRFRDEDARSRSGGPCGDSGRASAAESR